jgi:two-component system, LuxR family, response regulator FixJ
MTKVKPEPTVYIVDDDAAVRDGLSALLTVSGFTLEAFDSAERFLAAVEPGAAGCAILDIRMPGMSGLDLQRELKRRGIALPIIIITGHGDVPLAVAALKAGAVDFLEKPFDGDALLTGIEEALRRDAESRSAAFDRDTVAARVAQLTPREREVMDLVVAGHPNKVVADRLGIAVRTVEIHRARVMEKTAARNLSELIRMAILLEKSA